MENGQLLHLQKMRVTLANRSSSVYSLETQYINTNHFILCSSINKIMWKTLITTQQVRATTGGNRGFWVGRIKVTENTKQRADLNIQKTVYRISDFVVIFTLNLCIFPSV